MTLGTHAAFASVLYLGGATLFGYRPDPIGRALAAVARNTHAKPVSHSLKVNGLARHPE